MKIGNREFPSGAGTYVMGILNVTPDSFSDGGRYNAVESAVRHARRMIREGADIIDVGGESSRPGSEQIEAGEEIRRVVPVIRELKKNFDIPVSVDTCKSVVAEAALEAGADMLNDIGGLCRDENMAAAAAAWKVPVCLMHSRELPPEGDCLSAVTEDLKRLADTAVQRGVRADRIILDPGIGFGKNYEQNLILIHHLEDIVKLGYPVLLGVSRKSVIGTALKLPVSEREEGTIAAGVIGAVKGCEYVRVHDVEKNVRALRMTDAILRS